MAVDSGRGGPGTGVPLRLRDDYIFVRSVFFFLVDVTECCLFISWDTGTEEEVSLLKLLFLCYYTSSFFQNAIFQVSKLI